MNTLTNANVCPVVLRDFPTGIAVICTQSGRVVAAAYDLERAVDVCNAAEWFVVRILF